MNLFKSFILSHGDTDRRFSGYKNEFLKFSLFFHAVTAVHCLCMPNVL